MMQVDDQQSFLCKDVSISYSGRSIIKNINLTIPKGKITVILGANGCGKSTLLKGMAGLLKPDRGQVMLNGEDVYALPRMKLAKYLAILTQKPSVSEEMVVADLIKLGRHPYHRMFKKKTEEDAKCINQAIEYAQVSDFVDRRISTLSGGQQQRVWIAMALAQKTPWLFLDEPTTYLDLNNQISILNLLKRLNRKNGLSIIMVLHDINLACRYSDNIILIKNGNIHSQGSPESVISSASIRHVFDLYCDVVSDPVSHTPLCVPHLNDND